MNSEQPRMADRIFPPTAPPPMHHTTISSEEAHRIKVELEGTVVRNFLRELRQKKILHAIHPISFEVLWIMMDDLDAAEFVQHNLVCEISLGYICIQTGRDPKMAGSRAHISRAVSELISTGIVELLRRGNSLAPSRFKFKIPDRPRSLQAFPVKRKPKEEEGLPKKSIQRRCNKQRAPVQHVCSTGAGINISLARARGSKHIAPVQQVVVAPALHAPGDTTEVLVGGCISNSNTPPPSTDPEWTEELERVVVVELRKWGIQDKQIRGNKSASIEELLGYETSTPVVMVAAIESAKRRPEEHQSGFVVSRVRQPESIPEKFLRIARAKIAAMTAPTPSPLPSAIPSQPTIDHAALDAIAAQLEGKP